MQLCSISVLRIRSPEGTRRPTRRLPRWETAAVLPFQAAGPGARARLVQRGPSLQDSRCFGEFCLLDHIQLLELLFISLIKETFFYPGNTSCRAVYSIRVLCDALAASTYLRTPASGLDDRGPQTACLRTPLRS